MRVLERRVWEADDDLTVKLDPAGELFGLCSTSWSDGVLVFVYFFEITAFYNCFCRSCNHNKDQHEKFLTS